MEEITTYGSYIVAGGRTRCGGQLVREGLLIMSCSGQQSSNTTAERTVKRTDIHPRSNVVAVVTTLSAVTQIHTIGRKSNTCNLGL